MSSIIVVTKARHVADKIIELTFSDGLKGAVDFSRWIEMYPFFAPLREPEYFKNFSLDGWTVSWPNGADIAPETLYEIVVKSQTPQTV